MWQLPTIERSNSGWHSCCIRVQGDLVHLFWGFFLPMPQQPLNLTPEDVRHIEKSLGLPSESELVTLDCNPVRIHGPQSHEDLLASQCKIHLGSAVLMLVCYSGEMQLLGLLLHAMRTINGRIQSLRRNTYGNFEVIFHGCFSLWLCTCRAALLILPTLHAVVIISKFQFQSDNVLLNIQFSIQILLIKLLSFSEKIALN